MIQDHNQSALAHRWRLSIEERGRDLPIRGNKEERKMRRRYGSGKKREKYKKKRQPKVTSVFSFPC